MRKPATISITMRGPEPFVGLNVCEDCYRIIFTALDITTYAAAEGYLVTHGKPRARTPQQECEWCDDPFDVERIKRIVGHPTHLQTETATHTVTGPNGEQTY